MLDSDLPERRQDQMAGSDESDGENEASFEPSLADDITGLIDDGKTYVEAEIAFQKSRLSFALGKGRKAAFLGLLALGFLHLALIALVVGAVIALSPLLTPIGATLAVTVVLLVVAVIFVLIAKRRISEAAAAFDEEDE